MKPGYKTTEFWLIGAVVMIAIAGAVAKLLPDTITEIIVLLLPTLYAALRLVAKWLGEEQRLRAIELSLDFEPSPEMQRAADAAAAAITPPSAANVRPFPKGDDRG